MMKKLILAVLCLVLPVQLKPLDINLRAIAGAAAIGYGCYKLFEVGKKFATFGRPKGSLLHYSVFLGNRALVWLLLKAQYNPNASDSEDETPLFKATAYNETHIAKLLLDYNANPNIQIEQTTPLLLAAAHKNSGVIEHLLKYNAQAEIKDMNGFIALDHAIINEDEKSIDLLLNRCEIDPIMLATIENYQIFKLVVDNKDIIDTTDQYERNALHYAVRFDALEKVKMLINKIDPNIRDCTGNTPLHYAVQHIHINLLNSKPKILNDLRFFHIPNTGSEHLKVFLDYANCDINLQNNEGNTPLHLAAENSLSKTKAIIKHGANPNLQNLKGDTPLHNACKNYEPKVLQKLLEINNISLDIQNNKYRTAMHKAAKRSPKLVKPLLVARANAHLKDEKDNTPLHIACKNDQPKIVTALLNNSTASLNSQNLSGKTPLHLAIKHSQTSPIALLAYGADLNIQDDKGNTPLHIACEVDTPKVLKALLSNSTTNLNRKNLAGRTPLHLAAKYSPKAVMVLLEIGADPNIQDNKGNTASHYICKYDEPLIKEYTQNHRVNLNIKNNEGLTPLHYAAIQTYIAKPLILSNANPNAKDNLNRTPIHYLIESRGADFNNEHGLRKNLAYLLSNYNKYSKDNQNQTASELARSLGYNNIAQFIENPWQIDPELMETVRLNILDRGYETKKLYRRNPNPNISRDLRRRELGIKH